MLIERVVNEDRRKGWMAGRLRIQFAIIFRDIETELVDWFYICIVCTRQVGYFTGIRTKRASHFRNELPEHRVPPKYSGNMLITS